MAGQTVNFKLNGEEIRAAAGWTIWQAARAAGVFIPTLCHHEALHPFGACRLCVVEVEKDGKKTLEAACSYPAAEGLSVETETPRVQKSRKMTAALLLARCPSVPLIRELAARLGVAEDSLPLKGRAEEACILCGRCVRVCREAIGKRAVSFAYRGPQRRVSAPFGEEAPDCIGCTACVFVCPTGAVKAVRQDNRLRLSPWQTELPLLSCSACGRSFAAEKVLRHLHGLQKASFDPETLCPVCRRKQVGEALEKVSKLGKAGSFPPGKEQKQFKH